MLYIDNCDSLKLMQKFKDLNIKFDMIFSDPPYGIQYQTNHRKDKNHDFCTQIVNDDNLDFLPEFVSLSYDLLNNNSPFYCFCSWKKIDIFKQEIEKHFKIKNTLVWVKNNWTAGDLKGAYANQYELLIYATKGRVLLDGARDRDVQLFNRVSGNLQIHQNEKPTTLLNFIMNKHKGINKVLDPFMGSASLGEVCLNKNKDFYGIEIDPIVFNNARNRLKAKTNDLMINEHIPLITGV